MIVKDLIEKLQKCDPDTRIAAFANNHVTTGKIGTIRVWESTATYISGPENFILIGNYTSGDINGANFYATEEVK
jgi:hypothetical protein